MRLRVHDLGFRTYCSLGSVSSAFLNKIPKTPVCIKAPSGPDPILLGDGGVGFRIEGRRFSQGSLGFGVYGAYFFSNKWGYPALGFYDYSLYH